MATNENSLGIFVTAPDLDPLLDPMRQGAPFNEVAFGTALPKARGLHFGVFWGIEVPGRARPILFLHEQLEDDIEQAIAAQMDDDIAEGRLSQPEEYAELIRIVMEADVDERFDSAPSTTAGGAVYGGAMWVPLAESTLMANPKRTGGKLLQDTGELRQSFTSGGQIFTFS